VLQGVSVLQGGAAALLALVVLAVITGKLVWHTQLEQLRKDCDKRVEQSNAETARWRSAYEYSEESRRLDAKHAEQLLDFGRATNRILNALPVPHEGGPDAPAATMER
jgi:hypothetical protein